MTLQQLALNSMTVWKRNHKQPYSAARAMFVALERSDWEALLEACGLDDAGNVIGDYKPLPKPLFDRLNRPRAHVKFWIHTPPEKRPPFDYLRARFLKLGTEEWEAVLTALGIDESAELAAEAKERAEKPLPSVITRALNFTQAAAIHLMHGSPKCTDAQVESRLAICLGCEWYRPSDKTCAACGCPASRAKVYRNKLRWADSECPHPDGPSWPAEWKPLPVIQPQPG